MMTILQAAGMPGIGVCRAQYLFSDLIATPLMFEWKISFSKNLSIVLP